MKIQLWRRGLQLVFLAVAVISSAQNNWPAACFNMLWVIYLELTFANNSHD